MIFGSRINDLFARYSVAHLVALFIGSTLLFALPVSLLFDALFAGRDPAYRNTISVLSSVVTALPLALFCVLAIRSLARANQELAANARELDDRIEALGRARRAAETANQTKSMFLAQMSHELRTPLNSIIGFSDVLINSKTLFNEELPEFVDDYVRTINRSGQHLLAVINDLLDLSRVEAGRYEVIREEFACTEVICEVVETIRPLAAAEGQTIRFDPAVGPCFMHADVKIIKQVLFNLLSNAVKYSGKGALISVETYRMQDGLSILVSDNGPGMTVVEVETAMMLFGRLDNAFVAGEGTGLGLPIVKSLIELENGSLDIDSAPGRGTSVWIHYPASALLEPELKLVANA